MGEGFATVRIGAGYDALAPDGSEIRLLPALAGGSMAHCTLPPGGVSKAIVHRSVEEIWFVVSGRGALWRKQSALEEIVDVEAGVGLTIAAGTESQFRAAGAEPLIIVLVTMPPWPGPDEAVRVADHWPLARIALASDSD